MRERTLQLVADSLADDADYLARKLPEALERITDAMTGQPQAAKLDGSTSGGDHADPVANAGLNDDPARDRHRQLTLAVRHAAQSAQQAVAVVNRYVPRPASAIERRAVERVNEPHCQSCARIEEPKGRRVIAPPLTKTPSDVKGNLRKPMWLCRWCTDVVRLTGRIPTRREVRDHVAGKKVYLPSMKGATRGRL